MSTVRTSTQMQKHKEVPIRVKNTVTEMKTILEEIKRRSDDTEEHISDLEGRVVEITQTEQQKEFLKMRTV